MVITAAAAAGAGGGGAAAGGSIKGPASLLRHPLMMLIRDTGDARTSC